MSETVLPPADTEIVRFVFELGQLRRETRHGWLRIDEHPESVAEHSFRAAVLGYLLAMREGYSDPNRIATMILFHDMHEARTGDADTVQRRYVTLDEIRAARDQVIGLEAGGPEILRMWRDVEYADTEAGRIAKDAEILEIAFTARELVVRGNTDAQGWIESLRPRLKTTSAKTVVEIANRADPSEWWKRLQLRGDAELQESAGSEA
ncbi:MAG: HD domain-containing protein [Candidatus Eisenbacteria bacterium]|nr:HD domain-containing protein [Candidatus Eisenbacteria bacterium]